MRNEVVALGGNAAVLDVRTIESHLAVGMFPARAAAAMMGTLGLAAVALALVGVYGLVGSSVRSRTREIGIRMALGASPERVMSAMLWRWLVPSTIGILLGVAAFTIYVPVRRASAVTPVGALRS